MKWGQDVHIDLEEEGGVVIMHNPVVDTYMEAGEGGREEEEEDGEVPTFELQGERSI
jgi:hypothetical protein